MRIEEQFAELFEGRHDAFGLDKGGCIRDTEFGETWEEIAQLHLEGRGLMPIGVYPMVGGIVGPGSALTWRVKWGCVDFDRKSEGHKSFDYETEEECHTAAVNLQKVLAALGVTSWIERTRSCGRHVWVFAEGWVTASVMRRALLCACQVAGVSAREVNPKQETLAEGQLGNYVRVPYPGALTNDTEVTQVILQPWEGAFWRHGMPFSLNTFVERALAARTSPQVLEAIAAKWKAPEPTRGALDFSSTAYVPADELFHRLSGTGQSVFASGPKDGDRSRGMVYLAKQAKLSGLTPSEAFALLANAHWNKYRGRADEEKQLRDIVSRAWT